MKSNVLAECAEYERVSKLGVCYNFCFSIDNFDAGAIMEIKLFFLGAAMLFFFFI